MQFSYVYILQSQKCSEHFYVGLTDNLQDRTTSLSNEE
jgi:predicted GIY-YIG superfamily endonuclease